MTEQMQRDIETIERFIQGRAVAGWYEAWERIKASLSPDREVVWRAIRNAVHRNGGMPVTNDQWAALAHAAIDAMQGVSK